MNTRNPGSSTVLVQAEIFQRLVEGISDYAIYMFSPEGQVNSWNAGAQRFKGYEPAEVIDKHFSLFYTPEDRAIDKPATALRTARESGKFEDEGSQSGYRSAFHLGLYAECDRAWREAGPRSQSDL